MLSRKCFARYREMHSQQTSGSAEFGFGLGFDAFEFDARWSMEAVERA